MSSRRRDPDDLFEFDYPGTRPHRTPAPGRSEPFRQERNSSMSLPTPDHRAPLGRRSTTHRLPAYDPDEAAFHNRVTPPRLPALGEWERDDEGYGQPELSEADFTFIAGPRKPGAQRPERRKTRGTIKVLSRLAILPLALVLLVGAQGLIAHLSGDCGGARARQQQNCLTMGLFTAFSGSQAVNPPASPTATTPRLPAIPNDLPANVHSFVKLALPYAVQAHQQLGWPISVVLAQWGLEHGWSVPDAQGYNWGNTTFAPDCPYRGSRFCYASTPAEGLREYVYTARLNFYDGVRAAVAQGAEATALALGRSPWDAGHYGGADTPGSLLLSILRNFNFYRFDRGG